MYLVIKKGKSMQKKGFSFPEVLITLITIGIVVALVVPSMVNDANERKSKVSYKKAMSILSQATRALVENNTYCPLATNRDLALCYSNNIMSGAMASSTNTNSNVVAAADGMAYGFYITNNANKTATNSIDTIGNVCGFGIGDNDEETFSGEKAGCIAVVDISGLSAGSTFFESEDGITLQDMVNAGDKYPFMITANGVFPIYNDEITAYKTWTKGYKWIYGEDAEPKSETDTPVVDTPIVDTSTPPNPDIVYPPTEVIPEITH